MSLLIMHAVDNDTACNFSSRDVLWSIFMYTPTICCLSQLSNLAISKISICTEQCHLACIGHLHSRFWTYMLIQHFFFKIFFIQFCYTRYSAQWAQPHIQENKLLGELLCTLPTATERNSRNHRDYFQTPITPI